ncbi:MAG: DUF6527 family protein [Actinomycetota bacterium]|nr:DUF6527 family protein [Actinomycetota bacterium]MDA8358464.1 DUF6527 family protein [Actinomycetota bacterium]
MRVNSVKPRFVEFVPDTLEEGIVYVSIEYGAVIHSCCCGCGEKVSTPLSPAQWSITYDGQRISLWPSVGSGALPCNSHYIISRNQVQWASSLTQAQTQAAQRRDRSDLVEHYEFQVAEAQEHANWRSRIKRWLRRTSSGQG